MSDFELKLVDIESDSLGIPETEYKAVVNMPAGACTRALHRALRRLLSPPPPPVRTAAMHRHAAELQRICRDLDVLGDTVQITVTKEGIKFSVTGELGTGNITCRQGEGAVDDVSAHGARRQRQRAPLTRARRTRPSPSNWTSRSHSTLLCATSTSSAKRPAWLAM